MNVCQIRILVSLCKYTAAKFLNYAGVTDPEILSRVEHELNRVERSLTQQREKDAEKLRGKYDPKQR